VPLPPPEVLQRGAAALQTILQGLAAKPLANQDEGK
jgi:hypothetical protein